MRWASSHSPILRMSTWLPIWSRYSSSVFSALFSGPPASLYPATVLQSFPAFGHLIHKQHDLLNTTVTNLSILSSHPIKISLLSLQVPMSAIQSSIGPKNTLYLFCSVTSSQAVTTLYITALTTSSHIPVCLQSKRNIPEIFSKAYSSATTWSFQLRLLFLFLYRFLGIEYIYTVSIIFCNSDNLLWHGNLDLICNI